MAFARPAMHIATAGMALGEVRMTGTVMMLVGEGATHALRRAFFPLDDALDAAGIEQARRAARFLPAHAVAFSGPGIASRDTAAGLGLVPEVVQALRERDYGAWAGRSVKEVGRVDPDGLAAWLRAPDAAPPAGESLESLFARVAVWLDGRLGSGDSAILVAPTAVVRAAVLSTLGAAPSSFGRLDIHPLSFTELASDGRRWNVRSIGWRPWSLPGGGPA